VDALIDRLKRTPVIGDLVTWAEGHPRLAAWVVLATGMVVILMFEASDVGLEIGQWLALVIATVLVAGACIWIVSWEDEDELEASPGDAAAAPAAPDTEATPEEAADAATDTE
jgi:hypothetical protein